MATENKRYTIGIVFTPKLDCVLLIFKQRPDWQRNKWNFPGGHIEVNESAVQCVSREFKEETNLNIPMEDWVEIDKINNQGNYKVGIFTTIYRSQKHGSYETLTDEIVSWFRVDDLPKNVIPNIPWLTFFAKNCLDQAKNPDNLYFGEFNYMYPIQARVFENLKTNVAIQGENAKELWNKVFPIISTNIKPIITRTTPITDSEENQEVSWQSNIGKLYKKIFGDLPKGDLPPLNNRSLY